MIGSRSEPLEATSQQRPAITRFRAPRFDRGPALDAGKGFEALRSCGLFGLHDDVGARAVDDCLWLGLLLRGDSELVQRLLKIVRERVPFAAGDFQVFGFVTVTPGKEPEDHRQD